MAIFSAARSAGWVYTSMSVLLFSFQTCILSTKHKYQPLHAATGQAGIRHNEAESVVGSCNVGGNCVDVLRRRLAMSPKKRNAMRTFFRKVSKKPITNHRTMQFNDPAAVREAAVRASVERYMSQLNEEDFEDIDGLSNAFLADDAMEQRRHAAAEVQAAARAEAAARARRF
jgi:hypothetical protein